MKIALVTTFNKRLYDYYVIDLLRHIIGHLIYMFTTRVGITKEGIFFRDINKYNPELQEFIDRNSPKNVDSQYEKGKETTTDYKMDSYTICL